MNGWCHLKLSSLLCLQHWKCLSITDIRNCVNIKKKSNIQLKSCGMIVLKSNKFQLPIMSIYQCDISQWYKPLEDMLKCFGILPHYHYLLNQTKLKCPLDSRMWNCRRHVLVLWTLNTITIIALLLDILMMN